PTAAEVRFALFGAEENGLRGSRHYVSQMSSEDIERTVAMFQLDMIGARDAGHLTMFTLDGQTNTVTDLAASASSRVSLNEIPQYSQLGRSDHVPFHDAGIPAALFIHTPLEPWYHTSEDTIDKVSPEKVLDVTQIVGAALFNGARKDTPALHRSAVRPVPVDYYYEDPHL
ncbi:MAG TPA: M28 family peptidase, partial [Ornithinicoccus sp.]|nr:M28 family peptidase [Ornithinicoccus sp.]